MAHQEACQVYIEQEIKEGLAQGKTPYKIGKELSSWVGKLFETSIPAKTLTKRAERESHKLATNVANHSTHSNPSEILENQVSGHGGTRKGAGRPPKNTEPKPSPPPPEPYTDAVYFATIAVSQLSRIRDEDPEWEKAIKMISDWLTEKLKGRKL